MVEIGSAVPARGLPPGEDVADAPSRATTTCGSTSTSHRASCTTIDSPSDRRACSRSVGLAAAPAGARDHRERRDAESRSRRSRRCAALRGLGVSLALDDFGTGHSSLAHLREFPLDSLKIAQPFVDGLPSGHVDRVFIDAIVRLAASLELAVVAEGIETAAQANAVAELGCELRPGLPLRLAALAARRRELPRRDHAARRTARARPRRVRGLRHGRIRRSEFARSPCLAAVLRGARRVSNANAQLVRVHLVRVLLGRERRRSARRPHRPRARRGSRARVSRSASRSVARCPSERPSRSWYTSTCPSQYGAGADPDRGDGDRARDPRRDRGRDGLEHEREAAGGFESERVVEQPAGLLGRAALRLETTEHRRRLRRQPDVSHHRHRRRRRSPGCARAASGRHPRASRRRRPPP